MASIQCAIELYDGVTPVLLTMTEALESFSGRFLDFADEVGEISPDLEGLEALRAAFSEMITDAGLAYLALSGVLGVSETLAGIFSEGFTEPLLSGARLAILAIEEIVGIAEVSAEELGLVFVPAMGLVFRQFSELAADIGGQIRWLDGQIAMFAAGLPGYFAAPLAQISSQFATMASAARASLQSVAQGAAQTVQSVQTAMQATSSAPMAAMGNLSGAAHSAPNVSQLSGAARTAAGAATVSVAVHNENHISSEVDAARVIEALEVQLADAVASSVEGVYAR